MTPLRGHDLVRSDATIRYWTTGPVDAPTVVLLHGATLDHRAWIPQIDALQDRFHLVVPDLRAHGVSTGRFDFDAAVHDVLALLDELPAERVVLVGLSLGGNIAQELIRREPDRVHALVAADTTCNSAARHPFATSAGVAALRSHAMMAGSGFARQAARATATTPQAQQYALEVNAHRSNQETVDILTSLLTSALRPEPAYRLPVPALLVHGAQDRVGDIAAGMRAWSQREPLADYAVIPAAGHASNLDNPDAFTALVTTFLDELLHPVDPVDQARSAEAGAEELYRRYGARPWHLLPEATREHYRGLVAAGIDGRGQPLLPAAG
jgi:3-oxoadipate enol-lactonase